MSNAKSQIRPLKKELETVRKELETVRMQLRVADDELDHQDQSIISAQDRLCNLTSQLSESKHNMYTLRCETSKALQDADLRNKAILGIIAKVTSGEISIPYVVLMLIHLGTTVPEQLIDAVISACACGPLIEKAQAADQTSQTSSPTTPTYYGFHLCGTDPEALRHLIESLDAQVVAKIAEFLRNHQKIYAIKEFRDATKCGLRDAKDAVELILKSAFYV